MRERSLVAVVVLLVLKCALATTLIAAEQPPDVYTIHSELWGEKKHEDATFSHNRHALEYRIECTQCHHVYENGKNVWHEGADVKKCEQCHTNAKTGKELSMATDQEKKLSLYKAFHNNCRGCHVMGNKGPTKCNDCHKKKQGGPK